MKIDNKKFIVYDRESHSQSIKNKLSLLKQEGKLLGRPCHLDEDVVLDILDQLEKGISYRKIAKQHDISHVTVAKIKKIGPDYCKKIQKQNTIATDNQHSIHHMAYAKKLQIGLYLEHGLDITIKECCDLIKDIFSIKSYDDDDYEYYEYKPNSNYVELTSHKKV